VPGIRKGAGPGPPCRVIHIVGVEDGQAGLRELGAEAGGLMAGAFVALHEKMGQLPGLATSWP